MKIYISTFYEVRYFKSNMIPVSTAQYDPKWFHDFTDNPKHKFVKNDIIYGIRCEALTSPAGYCKGQPCEAMPKSCTFLKEYAKKLDKLDFNKLIASFDIICKSAKHACNLTEEPVIVLLVYEAVDNPCSERGTIVKYFAKHGITVKEFSHK